MGAAWAALPNDLKDIVARHINAAALREREDVRRLNDTLRMELIGKGMGFNEVDPEKFRETLRRAGFYAEWRARYGAEAWAALEKQVGTLN